MPQSHRIDLVQSPIIPIVGDLVRSHPGTVSLGQGVVHYGPPPEAVEEIQTFLANPENHKYHSVQGIPQFLQVIEEKLKADNDITIRRPEGENGIEAKVCVTAGANMAFMNAVLAIADHGDEIVIPTPYYFNQEMAIHIAGCKPVLVPTDESYQLDLEAIRAALTPRTRAVVTISPNNPTGVVYPERALRAVNELCAEKGIYHICDEAYEYFTYEEDEGYVPHFSPASIPGSAPHTISLFSLSKSYGFASWRMGYMVHPSDLEGAIRKIQDTILICPPLVSQYAALGALRVGSSWCLDQLPEAVEARRIILDELAQLGDLCTVSPSNGAFYFFLKINADMDDMTLVERLIREHGVALIPGRAFGVTEGCHLRLSYGPLHKDTAAEGIRRFVRGVQSILGAPSS